MLLYFPSLKAQPQRSWDSALLDSTDISKRFAEVLWILFEDVGVAPLDSGNREDVLRYDYILGSGWTPFKLSGLLFAELPIKGLSYQIQSITRMDSDLFRVTTVFRPTDSLQNWPSEGFTIHSYLVTGEKWLRSTLASYSRGWPVMISPRFGEIRYSRNIKSLRSIDSAERFLDSLEKQFGFRSWIKRAYLVSSQNELDSLVGLFPSLIEGLYTSDHELVVLHSLLDKHELVHTICCEDLPWDVNEGLAIWRGELWYGANSDLSLLDSAYVNSSDLSKTEGTYRRRLLLATVFDEIYRKTGNAGVKKFIKLQRKGESVPESLSRLKISKQMILENILKRKN